MTTLSTQHAQGLTELTSAFLDSFVELAGDYYVNLEALQEELDELGDFANRDRVADARRKFIQHYVEVEQLAETLESELTNTVRLTQEQYELVRTQLNELAPV